MAHELVNYRDVQTIANSRHFLRDALNTSRLCFSVVDCDPGWESSPHDHADDAVEEVYFLARGGATLVVEEEAIELAPGDAVRIEPATTRHLENGDNESLVVIASVEV